MKKILILFILIDSVLQNNYGQEFTFHSNSPFGIQPVKGDSTRATQKMMFSDYDGDGDLDLFHTGLDYFDETIDEWENIHYFIEMQENIGDQWNPVFADRTSIENFPFPLGYFLPAGGDLNDDGKTDFISFASVDFIGNRTGVYIRNMGDNTFETIRLDAMGLPDFVPESLFFPELLDLDGDGDLDLLMSGFDSAIAEEDGPDIPVYYYAKNVGTPSAPDLLGWFDNPYGLMPNPLVEVLTGGDMDNDGDIDILGAALVIPSDSINYLFVHINTPGPNQKPAFSEVLQSPYGLPMTFGEDQMIFPNLVDIDGDGDLDLFVFLVTPDTLILQYYENSLCTGETNEMSVNLCEGESITIGGNIYTEGGEYTISFEGSDGCDSTILLTIELLPIYTVSLNENICKGESFVIGNETFTDPGDYTVYVVAENGCDSIVLLSLFVHDIDNSVTLQQNTLTANEPFASYQWFNCDSGENIPGATDQSYLVLITGNYAVRLTDGFGCSAVSACFSIVITGIAEDALANAITIYPNPTEGMIYVLNSTQFPVSTLTFINLSGKEVGEFLFNGKNSVDVSSLGKGVYFVKIKIKGFVITKKLVVI